MKLSFIGGTVQFNKIILISSKNYVEVLSETYIAEHFRTFSVAVIW